MRILICVRPNAPTDRGGDWLQLEATLPPLRALGVHADYTIDPQPDFSGYDLCLIWNTVEPVPALYAYLEARRQNKPIAIMPIHWSLRRYLFGGANWRQEPLNPISAELTRLAYEVLRTRQSILIQGAAGLLPLSRGEADCLKNDFQAPPETMHIVHYGIDPMYAGGSALRFVQQFDIHDFILCIGFVSPRKNQANLIRALQDDPRPLVLMGDVEEPHYAEHCRTLAAQRTQAPVHFLPRQPATVVADALAAARVHAILSWYDVGPLVALEAAQAGCPQVVTTECGMPEYLRDEVYYADPEDLTGIRRAVDAAWQQPRSTQLAERLHAEFTWERSAREIRQVLEWTLANPRAMPDPARELAQIGEWTDRQVTLGYQLLETQGDALRAAQEWAAASDAHARETAEHAQALEVWAHELQALNQGLQATLDRIFNLAPVRATRYLRDRMGGAGANGQDKTA